MTPMPSGLAAPRAASPAVTATTAASAVKATPSARQYDYQVLATTRASTLEKQMNQAAQAGYVFSVTMGGQSSGGKEAVVIMKREIGSQAAAKKVYILLATPKMQKQLKLAGDGGFEYCSQTVYNAPFGGAKVVIIMERDADGPVKRIEYLLLAANNPSKLQNELKTAGETGFEVVAFSLGISAMGSSELVSIMRRDATA